MIQVETLIEILSPQIVYYKGVVWSKVSILSTIIICFYMYSVQVYKYKLSLSLSLSPYLSLLLYSIISNFDQMK